MHFFVPKASPEEAESAYAQLAEWCRRPLPKGDRRIYEIDWVHDGEEWTATVGEPLRGRRIRTRRVRGETVAKTTRLSDAAVVLAIFPGAPYLVVTDAVPLGTTRSAWVNPFMAGVPEAIRYFESVP